MYLPCAQFRLVTEKVRMKENFFLQINWISIAGDRTMFIKLVLVEQVYDGVTVGIQGALGF